MRGRRLLLHDAKTGPRTVWLGQKAQTVLAGVPRDPANDFVFSRFGRTLTSAAVDGCYVCALEAAGLGHVRLHDHRHSFASRAAPMSETLPMIAKLLGHTDIKMTARYVDLDDTAVLEVCERIGEWLVTVVCDQGMVRA